MPSRVPMLGVTHCLRCDGILSENICPLCPVNRKNHISCCSEHVRCGHCQDTVSRSNQANYCDNCMTCGTCCYCMLYRCLSCRAYNPPTSVRLRPCCTICYRCSDCCECTDRRELATLRLAARRARALLNRIQAAGQRRREQARAAELDAAGRTSGVFFLPSGTGKVIKLDPAFNGLKAEHIAKIFQVLPIRGEDGKSWSLPAQLYGFKENSSKRFVVPEIELISSTSSRASIETYLYQWLGTCVHDGSINSGGYEINLQPSNGDLYVRMINEICSYISQQGAKVDSSCGLHVHVDSRDFDYLDLRKLVFLYELIEPAFYACLPAARHTARFCIPCGFSYAHHLRQDEKLTLDEVRKDNKQGHKKVDLKKGTVEMVFGKGQKPSKRSKYGEGAAHTARYRGLNLYSHYYRGSAEFRHAPGSIDPHYIVNWALLCAGILDSAKSLSEKQILSLSKSLTAQTQDGHDLYNLVFRPVKGGSEQTKKMVLKNSTRILKDISQRPVQRFIDELQLQYRSVVVRAPSRPLPQSVELGFEDDDDD